MIDPSVYGNALLNLPSTAITGGQFVSPFGGGNNGYYTPNQRAELYKYAAALAQPQPVKNAWGGIGEVLRSIMGGYAAHQADLMEGASQAAREQGTANAIPSSVAPQSEATPAQSAPTATAPAPAATPSSNDTGAPTTAQPNRQQVLAMVASMAAKHGIDPKVGAAFVNGEMGSNPMQPGDDNSSFGPLQLHYGGVSKKFPNPGLGDEFTKATGLDARDPSTIPQQLDFAFAKAAAGGWSPWATTRDKLGFNNYTGIGSQGSPAPATAAINASAPPPGVAPPTRMGDVLIGNHFPVQLAQNGPVTAQALGRILAMPDVDPGVKAQIMENVAPKNYTGATGNVYQSRQGGPATTPIFEGGVRGPDINGVPQIITGSPTAPRNVLVPPGVAGQGAPAASSPANPPSPGAAVQPQSATPNVFGPGSVIGDLNTQKAQQEAHAKGLLTAGDVSSKQYSDDLVSAANFPRTSLPLTKAIPLLDQLGQTGTGPGSDTWNHAMSFFQTMGIPISDPNNIKAFDEVKKYLTDNVNQTGDRSTNDKLAASFAGNPSVEVSNAAASDVAKTALAMQRFKNAQILSYTKQPGAAPEGYSNYAKQFASEYDPRAFGIDLMTPSARKALFASMAKKPDANGNETNPDRIKFLKSLQIAQQTGMIPAPPSGQ